MLINNLSLAQNKCGTPKEKNLSILSLKNNLYTIVSLTSSKNKVMYELVKSFKRA
jgi:hypothetical protein